MGEPKQLLPFGKSTIVETVVDNMLGAKFDEVIVVVGHRAEAIQKQLGTRAIKTVFNPDYRDGMLTSAQTGIRARKENRGICSDVGGSAVHYIRANRSSC